MKIIIINIIIIGITVLIAAKQKDNPLNEWIPKKKQSNVSAKQFVTQIDSLGYFKYTSQEHLEPLKQSHLKNFDVTGAWGGMWDDDTFVPVDFRYYSCDGEYVFEEGGFAGTLEELAPTFKKIGFKITIEDHLEEWDTENQWLNHRITINGTEYVIFDRFQGYGWGEAVQKLAEILNTEFEKQGIDERIYLINGGNDGHLIFLDEKLYTYFYQVFSDPLWKPLSVNEWVKVMGITSKR